MQFAVWTGEYIDSLLRCGWDFVVDYKELRYTSASTTRMAGAGLVYNVLMVTILYVVEIVFMIPIHKA